VIVSVVETTVAGCCTAASCDNLERSSSSFCRLLLSTCGCVLFGSILNTTTLPRMSKSANKINKISKELFVYVALLFILLLTIVNINSFLKPKNNVLGAKTQTISEEDFWKDFLSHHPNYIPGWIELGKNDKVKSIDPNYF